MIVETLNNNGLIQSITNNNNWGVPVRMPSAEGLDGSGDGGKAGAEEHRPVRLNISAVNKLDFLRVLVALHEAGYFCDAAGGPVDRKDVFAAFGEILEMGFERANSNLSEGLGHWNQETRCKVFGKLEKAYRDYEDELLLNRKERV